MQLQSLLSDVPHSRVTGDPRTGIRGLAYDSRSVEPGFLFAAIRGLRRDGNDYVQQALERGASAVLSIRPAAANAGKVAWIQVDDDRAALAMLARNYYGRPDERLTMIGVTGTNGKTTVATLLEAILSEADRKPCLLGTVLYRYGRDESRAERTTPESLDLQRHLDRFATAGARSCVMEVSSHALVLGRVAGIAFRVGVFTNLTQDHLDFHGTMEAYLEAKARLFRSLAPDALAVLNADDPCTAQLRRATAARAVTYGTARDADVRLADLDCSARGIEARLEIGAGVSTTVRENKHLDVRSSLLGRPNALNLAAAAATGLALGLPPEPVSRGLESVRGVPGRLERVDDGDPCMVLVDYAHTEDALASLMRAVRELKPRRIITIFGCGGDRDRGKRPKMGRAAASGSDVIVVTSDNPRSEDPMAIINEILPGVRKELTGDPFLQPDPDRCLVIPDRREAIRRAVAMAEAGDCIVIAGKGHETYQNLGDRNVPFDDRQVARECLRARACEFRGRATG